MNSFFVLGSLFLLGVCVGGQLNRGIYRLAWHPRAIGPWSQPHERAPARYWYDRLPVVGWFCLSRESSLHGRGYWVRPLLIELSLGAAFAALYWHAVIMEGAAQFPPRLQFAPALSTLVAQYFCHLVLICLMTVATFIDFDEQTIPDAITIPGTTLGLFLAGLLPQSRMYVTVSTADPFRGFAVEQLHLASGTVRGWPAWLDGPWGVLLGLGCFFAWWLAVMPWFWTTRRGWAKGIRYLVASARRGMNPVMLSIAAAVVGLLMVVWMVGGEHWESLLSSLVGVAVGGALIWAVRILGSWALGQEAMGFGDVTLMAMIGGFLGWQATLIVFFLAPFAALAVSVIQWLLTRRRDIAFGPYLCVAALYLIVRWSSIWEPSARRVFSLGLVVPAVAVVCLALMWAMLTALRMLRR